MGSMMVSGPDLGGGYLHQLTLEDGEGDTEFVHHVQDGGADAGGPAPGTPEPFGFFPVANMCQYGGRACWHRRYALPPAASGAVRQAYNRWRFAARAMVDQEYGGVPSPLRETLSDVVDRLNASAKSPPFDWFIGGAAGLWLRGAPVVPKVIDIGSSATGIGCITETFREFLIEPLAHTSGPGGDPVLAARAFVGSLAAGMRVQWNAPVNPAAARGSEREWAESPPYERVFWEGRTVSVSPLEWALLRSSEQHRPTEFDGILQWARETGRLDSERWRTLVGDVSGALSSDPGHIVRP